MHEKRLKYKTRVLVFIFDKEEYSSELKIIREAGRLLAQRLSIRLGIVTDHKLIRIYKKKYGASWFNDEVQLSTIVLQRYDKKYFPMDILTLDSVGMLVHWLNKKSLTSVTYLTPESSKLLEMLN